MAIGAKSGVLILLSVNGDVKKSASIISFDTKDSQRFYEALPVEMAYRFQNTGGDRVKPKGSIIIRNILGIKATSLEANSLEGNVLPKQIRHFDVVWKKHDAPLADGETAVRNFLQNVKYEWSNFALGYFTAQLNLTGVSGINDSAIAETHFIVFPWQLLIVLLLVTIALIFIASKLLKGYNTWAISQARKMIRAEDRAEERKSTRRTKI